MRMSLHKLFKELQQLDYEDRECLYAAVREYQNIKHTCEEMGIRYSDKILIKWLNGSAVRNQVMPAIPQNNTKKIEKIIKGDNLDIIEEAAKKKGLL